VTKHRSAERNVLCWDRRPVRYGRRYGTCCDGHRV